MAITVGGLQVFIRDDTDRFQTSMRAAGTLVEQQSARMSRAVQGVSTSVERLNHAAASVNPNAFRALAVSALRAEDNVKRLEAAMVAVSALAGGFVGALVLRSLIQAADEYRNIQNRIATVVANENQRVAVNQRIFEIAQASRTEYAATASLFSRLSAATGRLGVSSEDVLKVVEAIQKSFALFGSSTAEAQSAAIQLAQGLASGRLQGDELKSILENNIPLAQILARELAGGDLGLLRELGSQGKLDPKSVFAAILKGSAEINKSFDQMGATVQQSFVLIANAATKYVGDSDKAYGTTRALASALKGLADNFQPIANGLLLIGAAFATVFLSNRFAAGINATGQSVAGFMAQRRAEIEALRQNAIDLQRSFQRAQFTPAPGRGSITAEVQAAVAGKLAQAEERLRKITEGRAALEEKLAGLATNTDRITAAALKRREAAEARIIDLVGQRAAIEAKAGASLQTVDRSKLTSFYKSAFDVDAARSAYDLARANEATAKAEAERFRQTMRLVGAEQALQGVQASGQFVGVDKVLAASQASQARIAAGSALLKAERSFAAEEAKIQAQQLSAGERFAAQVAAKDQQIAAQRSKIANSALAEQAAIAKAEEATEKRRLAVQQQVAAANLAVAQRQADIRSIRSGADEAIASRLIAQAGNPVAQAALLAEKANLAAEAQARLAAATTVTGRALAGLSAIGGSLVGFLGGPWGVAFTVASVAVGVLGAKSLAAAEQVRQARAIIDAALARSSQRADITPAQSDTIRTKQISEIKAQGAAVERENERVLAAINQTIISLAKVGPLANFAPARTELSKLFGLFRDGAIDARTLEVEVGKINGRYAGASQLADQFVTLANQFKQGADGAAQLRSELEKIAASQRTFRDTEIAADTAFKQYQITARAPAPQYPFVPPDDLRNSLTLLQSTQIDYKKVIGDVQEATANLAVDLRQRLDFAGDTVLGYTQAAGNAQEAIANLGVELRARSVEINSSIGTYNEAIGNAQEAIANFTTDVRARLQAIGDISISYANAIEAVQGAVDEMTARLRSVQQHLADRGTPLNLPIAAPAELRTTRNQALEGQANAIVARAKGDSAQLIRDRALAIYEENKALGANFEWALKVATAERAAAAAKKTGSAATKEATRDTKALELARRTMFNNLDEANAKTMQEAAGLSMTTEKRVAAAKAIELTNALLAKANELGIKNFTLSQADTAAINAKAAAAGKAALALEDMQRVVAAADEVRSTLGSSLGGFFNDLANGVKPVEALTNAFASLRTAILNAFANRLIYSLLGIPGTTLGTGGLLAGIFHGGGVVGAGGHAVRALPATTFAGAPRFHSGLKSDEMAAVLQRGERVLTASQNRRAVKTMDGLARQAEPRGAFTYAPVIDAKGADVEAVARLERGQAQQAAQLEALSKAQGRNDRGMRV